MRITESMRLSAVTLSQARAGAQLYAAARKASSGLAVSAPSEGPAAYAAGAAAGDAIARLGARRDALGQAGSDLDMADGALASAADVVQRAREIAIDMSSGEKTAADRAAMVTEVNGLRDALLALANTKGTHGYLFAGSATGAPPFDPNGAFVGNDDMVGAEIADGVVAAANASGARAFTATGGRDVLKDLEDLKQALAGNAPTLSGMIDKLDQSRAQIVTARGQAGMLSDRLRSAADITASTITTLQGARARDVEADPIDAYSQLAAAQAAYERSAQVTAKILSIAGGASG